MGAVAPLQQIAVIIATSNRFSLLANRSLPSVKAQTRCPDFLLVVDDSAAEARAANAHLVRSQALGNCEVRYIENERTEGASGAWNTALDFLAGEVDDPGCMFVAILDDDDCWAPDYLDRCVTIARKQRLDMVAADLWRFESVGGQPLPCKAPNTLNTEDFLTGNPGIQGSNLFVRLSLLLAAGGFDEALRSTTDRDLCIRIADLGTIRYGPLPIALVEHFAEAERSRLSSRGSQDKTDGLAAFWRKYVGRMSNDQRQVFSNRTKTLFDWRPLDDREASRSHADTSKKALVLGLIVDNNRPEKLREIVHELACWQDDTLVGLDFVLLERGRRCGERDLINEAATLLRDAGAGCFRFSLELQNEHFMNEPFPRNDLNAARHPTESHRELLCLYCAQVASSRIGTEVWLAEGTVRNAPGPVSLPSRARSAVGPGLRGCRLHRREHRLQMYRLLEDQDASIPDGVPQRTGRPLGAYAGSRRRAMGRAHLRL